MDTDSALEYFQQTGPDVIIVNGWQRLIWNLVLETVLVGAFGVHGSASGLPKGRCRSPMNWSLIEDLDRLWLSVMKLDSGVDSRVVVDTYKSDFTDFDIIRIPYYKPLMVPLDIPFHQFDGFSTAASKTLNRSVIKPTTQSVPWMTGQSSGTRFDRGYLQSRAGRYSPKSLRVHRDQRRTGPPLGSQRGSRRTSVSTLLRDKSFRYSRRPRSSSLGQVMGQFSMRYQVIS